MIGTMHPGKADHRVHGWDYDSKRFVPIAEIEDPIKRMEVSSVVNCPFNRLSRFQKGAIGASCMLAGGGPPTSGTQVCEGIRGKMCPLNRGVALVTVRQEDRL